MINVLLYRTLMNMSVFLQLRQRWNRQHRDFCARNRQDRCERQPNIHAIRPKFDTLVQRQSRSILDVESTDTILLYWAGAKHLGLSHEILVAAANEGKKTRSTNRPCFYCAICRQSTIPHETILASCLSTILCGSYFPGPAIDGPSITGGRGCCVARC